MKKQLLILVLCSILSVNAQTLSQFFGYNGWLPTFAGGSYQTLLSGSSLLQNSNQDSALRAQMVRIGGTEYDMGFKDSTTILDGLISDVKAKKFGTNTASIRGKSFSGILDNS
jgi:hypothetical protein